jgi:hypothetical protein
MLDSPILHPNERSAAVLSGLAGSPLSRYNMVLNHLGHMVAVLLSQRYGVEGAQEEVLKHIALRLDAEDQEIRQAFDSILPPGRKNLTIPQRNEV